MITKILELGNLILDAQCCFTAFCLRMLFVLYNEQVLLGSFIFTVFLYLPDTVPGQQDFSGSKYVTFSKIQCLMS